MPRTDPRELVDGRLRYFAADEFDVRAKTPSGTYRLFKIVFSNKDGSIFVPFVFSKEKRGFLSETDPATEPDPKTIQLQRNGGVTIDYDVKFSHHTSGIAHFKRVGGESQEVLPRRRSFPLDGPIGHLFWFSAFQLGGFPRVERALRRKEAGIDFDFPAHPSSIEVTAEWLRKGDMNANTDPDGPLFIGPDITMQKRATGELQRALVVGQPLDFPHQHHVVVLTAREVPLPKGANKPTAFFRAAYDAHEGKAPATARFLALMYTARD